MVKNPTPLQPPKSETRSGTTCWMWNGTKNYRLAEINAVEYEQKGDCRQRQQGEFFPDSFFHKEMQSKQHQQQCSAEQIKKCCSDEREQGPVPQFILGAEAEKILPAAKRKNNTTGKRDQRQYKYRRHDGK